MTQPHGPSPGRPPERRWTEEELAWYAADPRSARAWATRSRILGWVLVWTFVIGLFAHLLGWAIGSGAITVAMLPAGLVGELLGNLGLVLWTSAVVVTLLEVVPARIQRRAERYSAEAEAILRERGQSLPPVEPTLDDTIDAKLDRVMARLDELEGRPPRTD